MRTITLAATATLLALTACGGSDEPPKTAASTAATSTAAPVPTTADTTPPKAEDVKPQVTPAQAEQKLMMDYGAAMNAHDAKKLAGFYTDSATVKLAGMPDNVGRDAIQKGFEHEFSAFSDGKSQATRVWMKGDVAVVEWAWNAKHTGDMGPIKASEKPVGAQGVDVIWFTPDGSQIKEQHTYFDMGTIMSQIGVSKMKARGLPTVNPSTPPEVITSTNADTEQKDVDLANKMDASFQPKGENDFVGGLADDVQWDDFTQPDTMKGKEAGRKFFKAMITGFPDVKITPTNTWGIGDYAIIESTMTGTNKGSFFGMPAKNKPVTVHYLDIIQYKDGKAVKGWSYGNSGEMAMQLGLIPMPGDKGGAKPAPVTTPAPKK